MHGPITQGPVERRAYTIEVVDPHGVMRPWIGATTGFEVRDALSHERARDRASDLVICVLGARRDWELVQRLCTAGPTLVAVPGLTVADSLTAIELGSHGCVDVTVGREALAGAIRGILTGEVAFSRVAIGAWLRRQAPMEAADAGTRLTARQREIVGLIAEGFSDKEIAGRLGISPGTASKHVTNILERLGAPNRAAAVGMMSGPRSANLLALHSAGPREAGTRPMPLHARRKEDPATVEELAG